VSIFVEEHVLDGFKTIEKGPKTVLVRIEWAETIAAALIDGIGCIPAGAQGRGRLHCFSYSAGLGMIRTYRRGGVVRHFTKEGGFLRNRALDELEVHVRLWRSGLTVPEPLGACWQKRGPWYRCSIATRQLDSAQNLLEYLRNPSPETAILRECGRIIRQMHDLGVWHADLQLRNIVVASRRAYLIDFDRAVDFGEVSKLNRARNLLRLRRSFEKNRVDLANFKTICDGYGPLAIPTWLRSLYRLRGTLSNLVFR